MIDDHIRIGDAERARAAAALQRAHGEGRLEASELGDRLGRASAARTRGEMSILLIDVVGPAGVAELLGGIVPRTSPGPGYSWDDPLVITSRWDNEIRRGKWEVPAFLEVNPVLSSVKLDFTAALPTALVIDISLLGGAGDLTLVVPGSWGVDTHLVEKGMGSISNRVVERAESGSPQIIVRGKTKMGSLKVRYPNRFDQWSNARAMARVPKRPELNS